MSDKKRVLIVGGVAGGASAAARARRLSEEAEIILFERGSHISFANCGLPYHIGGAIPDREKLFVQTPEAMHNRFRIDVRTKTEVISINPKKKEVTVRDLSEDKEYTERYDVLILSPGAEPNRPDIPGGDSGRVLTLRSINDMDAIINVLKENKPERAVVVGAGYIGLEVTEALSEKGIKVSLVELAPQVMITADAEMTAPIKQQLSLYGVDLRLNSSITTIREEKEGCSVVLSTGETLKCGIVILSVGVKPEVQLAEKAGIKIGERGGIVVDEYMRTSVPDIYAVGDAVEVTDFIGGFQTLIPLAGPANRQGRIAVDNIFGYRNAYQKTQGTAICKVFDMTIAMTGMNERSLKRSGISYEKIYIHPANHAAYYPGSSPISLKLLFDPENGKILGAQAVGQDGVDKRIDVLATALRAGLTVYDLEHLELTYAPPYGSAKDPVNYAGFVAANILRGDAKICHYEDVTNLDKNQFLLDVRTAAEVEAGTIPGAHNIPIDELRERLDELPKHKEILIICHVGIRGYLSYRILSQNGYKCRNLSGGHKTYLAFTDSLLEPDSEETDLKDDTGDNIPEPVLTDNTIIKSINAAGLQCPGPIMLLKKELENIQSGQAVSISVSDPGFLKDIPSWCKSTGNKLINVQPENGKYTAVIRKESKKTALHSTAGNGKKKTIVVFSNDFDKVMAAFIIANGAVSMGSDVTLFFTFWGLSTLRKAEKSKVSKSFMEKLFSWMMPNGADKLPLSQMNMGGAGLKMMKNIMEKKNVNTLPELIESAMNSGAKLVACSMTMDIMGIKEEELINGVEIGGVAHYLEEAESGNVNLFIS